MISMLPSVYCRYLGIGRSTAALLLLFGCATCSGFDSPEQPRQSENPARPPKKPPAGLRLPLLPTKPSATASTTGAHPLLAANPNSFEINELTGLVYVALGQDEKAHAHLLTAVRLNQVLQPLIPRSPPTWSVSIETQRRKRNFAR